MQDCPFQHNDRDSFIRKPSGQTKVKVIHKPKPINQLTVIPVFFSFLGRIILPPFCMLPFETIRNNNNFLLYKKIKDT